MIKVEDWAEIRRLQKAENLPVRQIARVMNVSRNTVRVALRSDGPPKYERAPKGSAEGVGEEADQGHCRQVRLRQCLLRRPAGAV